MSLYGYRLIHKALKELRDGTGQFLSGLNVEGDQFTLELALEELEEMVPKIKQVLETVKEYDKMLAELDHLLREKEAAESEAAESEAAEKEAAEGERSDDSTD